MSAAPLPIDNPFCLFCGERVSNPTAESQCGNCGALACAACLQKGNTRCDDCGGIFGSIAGNGASSSQPPPAPPPDTKPDASAASRPQFQGGGSPQHAASSPNVPPDKEPVEAGASVPPPDPKPTAPAGQSSTSAPSRARRELQVREVKADAWKADGFLLNPRMGGRLVFWAFCLAVLAAVLCLSVFVYRGASGAGTSANYRPSYYSSSSSAPSAPGSSNNASASRMSGVMMRTHGKRSRRTRD